MLGSTYYQLLAKNGSRILRVERRAPYTTFSHLRSPVLGNVQRPTFSRPPVYARYAGDFLTTLELRFWEAVDGAGGNLHPRKTKEFVDPKKGRTLNRKYTSEPTIDFQGTFVSFRRIYFSN